MTYVIQHQTQHLWETEPRWNLIAKHDNLERCVIGIERIVSPMPGMSPRNAADYRIMETTKKDRPVAIYNADGELTAVLVTKKPIIA